MLKRDVLKGPSCLTKAEDDEPIFVLRANDEEAPIVVMFWAMRYFYAKCQQSGGITGDQLDKHNEAIELAKRMVEWKASR